LRKHHPTGRFNNGQKLAAYVFILTTPALVLTGLVLMFRDVFPEELVLLSRMIPVWSFAIVGIALLVANGCIRISRASAVQPDRPQPVSGKRGVVLFIEQIQEG